MTITTDAFNPGSLVSARGREWIVLPKPEGADPNLLLLRPIDGSEEETTGVLTTLEEVTSAQFAPPVVDASTVGGSRSCGFLRDAMRLSVRNSAGPFRSFGRIAVEPRPYQYVPLVLALRQNPTRLLIADDVGVGKTVETGMILRELLDRGEIKRFCVVCPPYLAEQWERELYDKFGIDAKVVLPSTVRRLERECALNESLFEVYPFTIVSIDFIKADRRRAEFLRTAPEAVVFDEAHAVSHDFELTGRHQRYSLAKELCEDPKRHVLLVTATPHSGKENAFRALLGLLNPEFLDETKYPSDLGGDANSHKRQEIAKYFVMRRRGDIVDFLNEKTDFPDCVESETPWSLSPQYSAFFDKVIRFAKELVEDKSGGRRAERIRWWSALALLRSIASSPRAAAATLNQRSVLVPAEGAEETTGSGDRFESLDQIGKSYVLDADAADADNVNDSTLGANTEPTTLDAGSESERSVRMRELAAEAAKLEGDLDYKLAALAVEIKAALKGGYSPIVFCRFIPTVHYLREKLCELLGKNVTVAGVTGELPPDERERRVEELGAAEKRVLVCTDCLSEGINLQERFDAVVHYDLSWNPTRHEQREGRVNRFGQPKKQVRAVTFYGKDNGIDGFVLEVLLRKHKSIKESLGLSVPLPTDTQALVETMINGLLLRNERYNAQPAGKNKRTARFTPLFPGLKESMMAMEAERLHQEWDAAAVRETKRSQTYFAHRGTSASVIDEVKAELEETRRSVGSSQNVEGFVRNVLVDSHAVVEHDPATGVYKLSVKEADRRLREYLPAYDEWTVRFELPARDDAEYVSRTHPLVSGLCDYVVNTALDPAGERPLASRCGAIVTDAVKAIHVVALLRHRFHLVRKEADGSETETLAEDVQIVGFTGAPSLPIWLDDAETERLLNAKPTANMNPEHAAKILGMVVDELRKHDGSPLLNRLTEFAQERAAKLKESHLRVRRAAKLQTSAEVRPETPPDVVGIYAYIPDRSRM